MKLGKIALGLFLALFISTSVFLHPDAGPERGFWLPKISQVWHQVSGYAYAPFSLMSYAFGATKSFFNTVFRQVPSQQGAQLKKKRSVIKKTTVGFVRDFMQNNFSESLFLFAVKVYLEKKKADVMHRPKHVEMVPGEAFVKYPMSLLQAAYYCEREGHGKILLSPIGLWNNGKYADVGKKRWEVIYRGKTYKSTFDDKENRWQAGAEDQMDILVYYDYLIENNKNALRDFYKYLVDTMIDLFPQIFAAQKNNPQFVDTLTQILLNEEEHKDYFVFYYGGLGVQGFIESFFTYLHRYLDLSLKKRERSKLEACAKYSKMGDFLSENVFEWDCTSHGRYLMSTNIGLFGNMDNAGECTSHYFSRGRNVTMDSRKLHDLIQEVCTSIGLPVLQGKLDYLLDKYAETHGRLKQIFIPKKMVDNIVYMSFPMGLPITKNNSAYEGANNAIEEMAKYFTGKSVVAEKDFAVLIPSTVISGIRNFGFANPADFKKNMGFVRDSYLQARILHPSPSFTDQKPAHGIKIYYYFAREKDREKSKKYNKQVDEFVREMISEGLKSGTLKLKDVRLHRLYEAVKVLQNPLQKIWGVSYVSGLLQRLKGKLWRSTPEIPVKTA